MLKPLVGRMQRRWRGAHTTYFGPSCSMHVLRPMQEMGKLPCPLKGPTGGTPGPRAHVFGSSAVPILAGPSGESVANPLV
jgi:hypothetical protein